jgi:hypothetical protein
VEPTPTKRHYTFLVKEARYGGVYEGGAWTAFLVNDRGDGCYEVPEGAWGGDVQAAEWWWNGPSVPVASGDTPEAALENLRRRVCQILCVTGRDGVHRTWSAIRSP